MESYCWGQYWNFLCNIGTRRKLVSSKNLVASGASGTQVGVAIDSIGNAVAIWVGGSGTTIQVSSLSFGASSWSAATTLDAGGSGITPQVPVIAMNGSSQIIAAWIRHFTSGNNQLLATTSTFGGSWATNQEVNSASDSPFSPAVTIDTSGNTFVGYAFLGAGPVKVTNTTFGGTWPASQTQLTTVGFSPLFAINSSNQLIVTFTNSSSAPETIKASKYSSGS